MGFMDPDPLYQAMRKATDLAFDEWVRRYGKAPDYSDPKYDRLYREILTRVKREIGIDGVSVYGTPETRFDQTDP